MIVGAELSQAETGTSDDSLLGESTAIQTLHELIRQFADTPFPVLIEGESGSGKELVAQYLHDQSRRGKYPFSDHKTAQLLLVNYWMLSCFGTC